MRTICGNVILNPMNTRQHSKCKPFGTICPRRNPEIKLRNSLKITRWLCFLANRVREIYASAAVYSRARDFQSKRWRNNIICTQPRRISAIGLAERVANERDEKVGGVVGYSRLESKTSKETRLLFCTTGILLRRLLSDSTLENVTHVILDEVHERSVDSDVLPTFRRVAQKRPKLKLVLMSATADADLFADYFQNSIETIDGKRNQSRKNVQNYHSGVYAHPVKEYYLEDVFNETSFLIGQKSVRKERS